MADSVEKEVLINLRLVPDPANAAAAAQVQEDAAKAHKAALEEAKKSAEEQKQLLDSLAKASERAFKTQRSAADEAAKASESVVRQQQQQTEAVNRAKMTATVTFSRAHEKAMKRVGESETNLARQQERLADAVAKAREDTSKQSVKAAEKAATDVLRAEKQLAKDRERLIDVEEQHRDKVARNRIKLIDRMAKDEQRQRDQAARAAETASNKLESLNNQRAEGQQRIAEESRKALQGTLDIAKGMSFLGLVGEENLEKIARGLVKIESGFLVMKGGIDLFFGVRNAIRFMRQETILAAAANEALAASQLHVQKTAVTSGAAGVGQTAATAAAAANVAPAAVAAKGFLAGAKAIGFAALKLSALALAAAEGVQWIRRLFGAESESIIGAFFSMLKARTAAAEAERKTEEMRIERLRDRINLPSQKAAIDSARLTAIENLRSSVSGAGMIGEQRQAAELAHQLAATQLSLTSAMREAVLETRRVNNIERIAIRGGPNLQALGNTEDEQINAITQARQQQLEKVKQLRDAQQALFDLYRQQEQTLANRAESLRQEVATAKELVALEKQRFDDRLAQFGALDKMSQVTLERIADKIEKQGEAGLGRGEIEALRRSGFGGDIVRRFDKDRGIAADGDRILKVLGENAGIKTAQDKLAQVQQQQIEVDQELVKASNLLKGSIDELSKTIDRVAKLETQQLEKNPAVEQIKAHRQVMEKTDEGFFGLHRRSTVNVRPDPGIGKALADLKAQPAASQPVQAGIKPPQRQRQPQPSPAQVAGQAFHSIPPEIVPQTMNPPKPSTPIKQMMLGGDGAALKIPGGTRQQIAAEHLRQQQQRSDAIQRQGQLRTIDDLERRIERARQAKLEVPLGPRGRDRINEFVARTESLVAKMRENLPTATVQPPKPEGRFASPEFTQLANLLAARAGQDSAQRRQTTGDTLARIQDDRRARDDQLRQLASERAQAADARAQRDTNRQDGITDRIDAIRARGQQRREALREETPGKIAAAQERQEFRRRERLRGLIAGFQASPGSGVIVPPTVATKPPAQAMFSVPAETLGQGADAQRRRRPRVDIPLQAVSERDAGFDKLLKRMTGLFGVGQPGAGGQRQIAAQIAGSLSEALTRSFSDSSPNKLAGSLAKSIAQTMVSQFRESGEVQKNRTAERVATQVAGQVTERVLNVEENRPQRSIQETATAAVLSLRQFERPRQAETPQSAPDVQQAVIRRAPEADAALAQLRELLSNSAADADDQLAAVNNEIAQAFNELWRTVVTKFEDLRDELERNQVVQPLSQ